MMTNEPVTPETLTREQIQEETERRGLAGDAGGVTECFEALGPSDMFWRDSQPSPTVTRAARQRICDAIKAGRVVATIALMLTSCATPAITGNSEQESSAGVCGEPPLRCNPDDSAAQQRCQEVCSEEGGDGFCPPFTTTEIVYCATHCRPDGTTSDPRRCNLLNCDDPIVQHTCTFGSRP